MRLNWKIRRENVVFWVRVALGFALPVLAYFGMGWESLISWQVVAQTLMETLKNPYVLVLGLIGAVNAFVDPTTPGLGDSDYALGKSSLSGLAMAQEGEAAQAEDRK